MRWFKREKINLSILMKKKEKVLNLLIIAQKGRDTNRVSYLQGQIDLLVELVNEK